MTVARPRQKQIDGNYFQTKPYLDVCNRNRKTDLVKAATLAFLSGKARQTIAPIQRINLGVARPDVPQGAPCVAGIFHAQHALLYVKQNGTGDAVGDHQRWRVQEDLLRIRVGAGSNDITRFGGVSAASNGSNDRRAIQHQAI
ncbi:uncharacterized protein E0L32_010771 [Thyridium curvatum]|uniref:Uncharacterized protein n=1 Tax=Thyridium curvatum TaxID=1093900 RepID=A0A507AM36_9PEZI|nr:uncharacterized protein E0L32_010771 [Thyridium curvatum]TPX07274.1 hypothetical protein E0L32_010771 [Thyridium curvatum]